MSFGKRMREKRGRIIFTLAAFAAAMALPVGVAPVQGLTAPTPNQTPREFVAQVRQQKSRKQKLGKAKPKGGGIVKFDSRHLRRRFLMEIAGRPNSGRQWVRVKRGLRAGPFAFLLGLPAWQLAEILEKGKLVRARADA